MRRELGRTTLSGEGKHNREQRDRGAQRVPGSEAMGVDLSRASGPEAREQNRKFRGVSGFHNQYPNTTPCGKEDLIPFEGVNVAVIGPPIPYFEDRERNGNTIMLCLQDGTMRSLWL